MRKGDVLEMIQIFVARLPSERQSRLPFVNGRPGPDFFTDFLRRHPEIRIRRRAALEQARNVSMCPRTLAMHYARLEKAYQKYKITSPCQILNIDESGVSSHTGGRAKRKGSDAREWKVKRR